MIAFDEFTSDIMLLAPIPRADDMEGESPAKMPRPMTQVDRIHLVEYLQWRGFVFANDRQIKAAIMAEAYRNSHNTARQMLDTLPAWDGETLYLARFMKDVCGAKAWRLGDTEEQTVLRERYFEELGRILFLSIVGRIMVPGAKSDAMVILEGDQGIGKSTLARLIAVKPEWFSDSLPAALDKEARMHLRGKLIVEIPEMKQAKANDVEKIKSFLSGLIDMVRLPWGERDVPLKRTCTFIGTTNEDTYMADQTGNRRYLPVKVGTIDLDLAKRWLPFLYAEALARWRKGETTFIDDPDLLEAAKTEQREREEDEDPWITACREVVRQAFESTMEDSVIIETHVLYTAIYGSDMRSRDRGSAKRLGLLMRRHFQAKRLPGRYASYQLWRTGFV